MLFGPRLIRTVGAEIIKLDQMRAYCVALSAAITVILASALGLFTIVAAWLVTVPLAAGLAAAGLAAALFWLMRSLGDI